MKRIQTEVDGETRLENFDGLFIRVEGWHREGTINAHIETTEMFPLLLYLVSLFFYFQRRLPLSSLR